VKPSFTQSVSVFVVKVMEVVFYSFSIPDYAGMVGHNASRDRCSVEQFHILSQMNRVHVITRQFFKIDYRNINLSTLKFLKRSLPLKCSDRNPIFNSYLSHSCYMSRQFHPP
jgi:hypothetical protein